MIDEFSDLIPYHSWLYVVIALIVIISYRKYGKNCGLFKNKTEKISALIYGALFVGCYITGVILSSGGLLNKKSIGFVLMACFLFSGCIGLLYHFINCYLENVFNSGATSININNPIIKHPFLTSCFVMIFAWLPVFFALYPGLFSYDVVGQINQTAGHYSTHHPLLHTFYLKLFYKIGSLIGSHNTGMAISVVIQMVLFAMSLSYTISYMHSRNVKEKVLIFTLIFFSVVPIFPIMAVSMTKDILFAAAFNVLFIFIVKISDNSQYPNSKMDYVFLLVFIVLTALLRSNGKYAVYAAAAAMIIQSLIRKECRKKICAICLLSIVFVVSCDKLLVFCFNAAEGSKNEMMSIPYQQVARVYKYNVDVFSEKDLTTIETLLPTISQYNEFISDPVKYPATTFDSFEDTMNFGSIYLKCFAEKPNRYVEAFMLNTMGYWYLDDISSSQMYGKRSDGGINDDFGIFLMDTKGGFGVTHESKIPFLDNLIKQLFHVNKYQNIPVVAILFNMGLYFWIVLGSLFYAIQAKKKGLIVPVIFLVTLAATVFAGPCALFRYALPCIVCIPTLLTKVYSNS